MTAARASPSSSGTRKLAAGEAMVKDLVSGEQERLALHAIPARIGA